MICLDEITRLRSEAQHLVHIPVDIVQLIVDIRDFMHNQLEPPVYVSDRRLIKAVNMLKVASFTNGRSKISQFDCLLLQHCLWQKPEEQVHISKFIVDKLSADEEIPNFELLMQRIFARCCLVLTGAKEDVKLRTDLGSLQDGVLLRLEQLTHDSAGMLSVLTENIWIDGPDASSIASSLIPKMKKTMKQLEELLMELEVLVIILDTKREPSICAELLGNRWADFVSTPLQLNRSMVQ